jgi:hypothetical protein
MSKYTIAEMKILLTEAKIEIQDATKPMAYRKELLVLSKSLVKHKTTEAVEALQERMLSSEMDSLEMLLEEPTPVVEVKVVDKPKAVVEKRKLPMDRNVTKLIVLACILFVLIITAVSVSNNASLVNSTALNNNLTTTDQLTSMGIDDALTFVGTTGSEPRTKGLVTELLSLEHTKLNRVIYRTVSMYKEWNATNGR